MNIKKILFSLFITIGMTFSITAFADDGVGVITTGDELKQALSLEGPILGTITLGSDIEVTLTKDYPTVPVAFGTLDLNGHTLTIKYADEDSEIKAGVSLVSGVLRNGKVVIDYNTNNQLEDENPTNAITVTDGANKSIVSDIEVQTAEGKSVDYVIHTGAIVDIVNCNFTDVDVTEGGNVFGGYYSQECAGITVVSGSYKDLDEHNLPTCVSLAEGSKALENLDGVNGMVIASPQTQAIVVKDGKAYTYDSFEEAKADAAVADGAELLQNKGDFVFGIPVIWASETDAGYYMDAKTKYGVIRFLFDSGVDASEIKGSGIKFAKSSDITQAVNASVGGGDNNSRAFYGDITQIPADDSSTYYAVAYVTTTDGSTSWSNVVECTPDFNTLINYEGGNE